MFPIPDYLKAADPEIADVIYAEAKRQETHLELIASENFVSPAVLAAMGSVLTNKYAEGYPGHRYYGGCLYVDEAEELRRIETLLPGILSSVDVPVSVDTFRPAVAEAALSMGAKIINDISGRFCEDMVRLVKNSGAGYVVMHAGPEGAATAGDEAWK